MKFITAILVTIWSTTAMANYLDLKKSLVDDTGMPQLVTDAAGDDFSDHTTSGRPKASTFLNDANSRLEESLVELRPQQSVTVDIVADQYELDVPGFRYISGVDLQKDDTVYTTLRRSTHKDLRQHYKKSIRSVTPGRPRWWHRRTEALPVETEFQPYAAFDVAMDATLWATSNVVVYDEEIYDIVRNDAGTVSKVRVRGIDGVTTRTFDVAVGVGYICVESGAVWIYSGGMIHSYTTAGVLVSSFTTGYGDGPIAVHNGEVFHFTSARVTVYTTSGVLVRTFTTQAEDTYSRIAVDDNYIYLSALAGPGGFGIVEVVTHAGVAVADWNVANTDLFVAGCRDGLVYIHAQDNTIAPPTARTETLVAYTPLGVAGDSRTFTSYDNFAGRAYVNDTYLYHTPYTANYYAGPTDWTRDTGTLYKQLAVASSGDIVIAPPSDGTYTATVFGGPYATQLVDDDDETWMSVNCPRALLLMARAYIELRVFNNKSSFRAYEEQALREANERWHNYVYEQVKNIPREERRLQPLSFGSYRPDEGNA